MKQFELKLFPSEKSLWVKPEANLMEILVKNGFRLPNYCAGTGRCKKCIVKLINGSLSENAKHGEYYLACLANICSDVEISLEEEVSTSSEFKNYKFALNLPTHLNEPSTTKKFGLAVDIGTTTVEVLIADLVTGETIGGKAAENSQSCYGADVISRIIVAEKGENLKILQSCIITDINNLVADICNNFLIQNRDIHSVTIAANPTMNHIFAGISPSSIRKEPYKPVFSDKIFPAQQVGLNVNQNAAVYIYHNVGNYVGGDITAGILATGIHKQEKLSLLIDIGTNGEIVLGCQDWLLACACSAGPAFEGAGIRCGTRAKAGAISEFCIDTTGKYSFQTISGSEPIGICGSGMIDIVAELFDKGIIDRQGKFIYGKDSFEIFKSENKLIDITNADIENIIRTKGAIFAGIYTLLSQAGLDVSDIEQVFVAGGIGSNINFVNALKIGMLPDIPLSKYNYSFNTSLEGAYLGLVDSKYRQELNEIYSLLNYLDISGIPEYMDFYIGSLFLPHTDRALFPSINISKQKK